MAPPKRFHATTLAMSDATKAMADKIPTFNQFTAAQSIGMDVSPRWIDDKSPMPRPDCSPDVPLARPSIGRRAVAISGSIALQLEHPVPGHLRDARLVRRELGHGQVAGARDVAA